MGSLFRPPLLKATRTFTVQGAVITVIIVVRALGACVCCERGTAAAAAAHHSRGHVHCKPSYPVPSHTRIATEDRKFAGPSQNAFSPPNRFGERPVHNGRNDETKQIETLGCMVLLCVCVGCAPFMQNSRFELCPFVHEPRHSHWKLAHGIALKRAILRLETVLYSSSRAGGSVSDSKAWTRFSGTILA